MQSEQRTSITINGKFDENGKINVTIERDGVLKYLLYTMAYATLVFLLQNNVPFVAYLHFLEKAQEDLREGYTAYHIGKEEARKQTEQ